MAEFKINGTLNTTKGVKTKGTNYILVSAAGTAIENGNEFIAAYNTATNMSPSDGNRITIVASPGYYEFQGDDFEMSEPYIDLVSLDGNRSIKIVGSYTFRVTANNIYVNGVNTGTLPFKIDTNIDLRNTVIENCKGGDYSFGYNSDLTTVFTINATFIDCTAGNYSFGATISSEDSKAFAAGSFIRCTAGNYSFGSGGEFSGPNEASGIFIDCTADNFSFGSRDNLDGNGVAGGQFTRCIAGSNSFGQANASGVFMYCQGGDGSFGGNAGLGGQITGGLYYCRKQGGQYANVNPPGVIRLCIDVNNDVINQPK